MYHVSPEKKHALFDHLISANKLKNDAALCKFLGVKPAVISKVRSRRFAVSADIILLVHDVTGMSVKDIRFLVKQAEIEHAAAVGAQESAGAA